MYSKSPVTPERRPHSVSTALKKLKFTQVRAVQSPATLWKRSKDAMQSSRTPCDSVYFEHAQNKGRGYAFAKPVRQLAVRTSWQRCGVF